MFCQTLERDEDYFEWTWANQSYSVTEWMKSVNFKSLLDNSSCVDHQFCDIHLKLIENVLIPKTEINFW